MFYEMINNSDMLKKASEQVANATNQGGGKTLNKISFDLTAIGSQGVVISIIGYVVVFIALVALFFFVKEMAKLLNMKINSKLKKEGKHVADKKDGKSHSAVSGEVAAAIATAINLHYQEAHDIEATVLTIEQVKRRYSPWSSKLHGIRQYPTRR